MNLPKILLIDDEYQFCRMMAQDFGNAFTFRIAKDIDFGWHYLRQEAYDLLLLDLKLIPEGTYQVGIDLIPEIKKRYPYLPLIAISDDEERADIVLSMKNGADDFLWKVDYNIPKWTKIFHNTLKIKQLEAVNTNLKTQNDTLKSRLIAAENNQFPFIGNSEAICNIRDELENVGQHPSNITLLVTGETGVGKEVAARYFHRVSNRADQVFRTVPLSSMSANLIESDLFGHKKGAFTDAKEDKKGYFVQADKGILFLDEIGDINHDVQLRLLNFLQNRIIRPQGSDTDIALDVQIVAATNKNLKEAIGQKAFREDLFYRLNGYTIHIPPLRERVSDIPLLLAHYMKISPSDVEEYMTKDTYKRLIQHPWYGNIRELAATANSMMLRRDLARKERIDEACLPEDIRKSAATSFTTHPSVSTPQNDLPHEEEMAIADLKRIEQALSRAMNNKSIAAQSLNMTADDMRYRVNKYHKNFPEHTQNFHHIHQAYLSKK